MFNIRKAISRFKADFEDGMCVPNLDFDVGLKPLFVKRSIRRAQAAVGSVISWNHFGRYTSKIQSALGLSLTKSSKQK